MQRSPVALLEAALSEQVVRNAAALAAIHACADDIGEAQRLVEALAARGLKVQAAVTTQPVGALAICDIALWLSATRQQLTEALAWLAEADIAVARDALGDRGDMRVYVLTLRGQKLKVNVAVHGPEPRPFKFVPGRAPEAA
jgi:hypothetical protein